MRKQVIAASVVGCVVIGLVFADDKSDSANESKSERSTKRETIVYSVRSAPVRELLNTLDEFFEDSGVRIVAEPTSNLLIIQVDAGSRDDVLGLLDKLDQPLNSVVIQAQLLKARGKELDEVDTKSLSGPSDEVSKRIRDLERDGRLFVANRMELTAVENQQVMMQVGERVAVVTGATRSREGGSIKSYRSENVGTLISVQARVSKDGGITMQVSFEKSEVVEPDPEDDDKASFTPSDTATMTQQTTLQVRDGHTVLVGGMTARSSSETEEAYLVVSAKIVGNTGRPVLFRSFSQRSGSPRVARSFSTSARDRGGFSARRPSTSSDPRARYETYARGIIARYDKNKDGVLTAEEWKSMSTQPTAADADKDGKITSDEFVKWLQNRGAPSRRPPAPASRN